jgi:hypothetical protein
MGLKYFPNRVCVTYWVRLPIKDTYKWVTQQTVPKYSLAAVPGAFFLFKSGYKLVRSNMVRLGLGNINPKGSDLTEALEALEKALKARKSDITHS